MCSGERLSLRTYSSFGFPSASCNVAGCICQTGLMSAPRCFNVCRRDALGLAAALSCHHPLWCLDAGCSPQTNCFLHALCSSTPLAACLKPLLNPSSCHCTQGLDVRAADSSTAPTTDCAPTTDQPALPAAAAPASAPDSPSGIEAWPLICLQDMPPATLPFGCVAVDHCDHRDWSFIRLVSLSGVARSACASASA